MTARVRIPDFGGRLIVSGDEGYETARATRNAAFDRHPVAIAQALGTDDVASVLRYVAGSGLTLSVRSGGHSVAGHSTGDGVLVLDLSAIDQLAVDSAKRTAWAGPGVRALTYTRAAAAFGLATSFGDTGSVALGGLIVGGGIGWLVRRHGLTIDSLLAADVVTADGELVRADADHHADLFWALRGGGGNFGVVTRYQLALQPIGQVLHGTLLLAATPDAVRSTIEFGLDAPDELTMMPVLMRIPPMDEVAPAAHGSIGLFIDLLWAGDEKSGARIVDAVRGLGPVLLDTLETKTLPAVYGEPSADIDAWTGHGFFVDRIEHGLIEILLERLGEAPEGECLIQLRPLGGAVRRVALDATAFDRRDMDMLVWIIADYGDPGARARIEHEAWLAGTRSALGEHAEVPFLSFAADDAPAVVEAAYRPATWARLGEVKRQYDPANLFRHNFNIPPV